MDLTLSPAEEEFRDTLRSWIEENQLGDPQKAPPCGGTNADFGKPVRTNSRSNQCWDIICSASHFANQY